MPSTINKHSFSEARLYDANGIAIEKGLFIAGHYVGSPDKKEMVPVTKQGGVYFVRININGLVEVNAVIDSGASDISIPSNTVSALKEAGSISEKDFLEPHTYVLADGRRIKSQRFRVQTLRIGNKTLRNLDASVRRLAMLSLGKPS